MRLLTSSSYLGIDAAATGFPDSTVGKITVSLASANGVWMVGLLSLVTVTFALPVGVALRHPAGQRFVGWTIGWLVLVFSVVSGLSVGLTYLPAAVLVLAGAALSPGPGSSPAAGGPEPGYPPV